MEHDAPAVPQRSGTHVEVPCKKYAGHSGKHTIDSLGKHLRFEMR